MGNIEQFPSLTEEDYKKADMSIWWDTESCSLGGAKADRAVSNIRSALNQLNYQGKTSVYVYGSKHVFLGADILKLAANNIYSCEVSGDGKLDINKKILPM